MEYKVGDKVRIVNAERIEHNTHNNEDIRKIERIDNSGFLELDEGVCISPEEYHCIEKVEDTPEKSAVNVSVSVKVQLKQHTVDLTREEAEDLMKQLQAKL